MAMLRELVSEVSRQHQVLDNLCQDMETMKSQLAQQAEHRAESWRLQRITFDRQEQIRNDLQLMATRLKALERRLNSLVP